MKDRRENITRLERGRRNLAFNLSVAHQEINGFVENTMNPRKGVDNYLMVEDFSLVFHGRTLDLRTLESNGLILLLFVPEE